MYSVGVQPNMVLPTRDCKTVVVVVEAEIDRFSGVVKDFEGGVAVIKFPTTLDDTYTMTIVNFSHYDSRYLMGHNL